MKSFNVALLVDIALYELFCELKVMGTMAIVHSVILGFFLLSLSVRLLYERKIIIMLC